MAGPPTPLRSLQALWTSCISQADGDIAIEYVAVRDIATRGIGHRWMETALAFAGRHPFFMLACAYFLLNVARLPDVTHYFQDEQYYTNSAIRMAQGGSWLVPVYPDGEPRLEKPLLSYWLIALSFKTFGIGLFASRLPFLLAGAALVWATARLALALFGSMQAALLAPIVLMTSSYFDRLAVRATPDVLVCLFVTISWVGLARIYLHEDRSWQARAQLWIGAACCVATKGGMGLIFLAFSAAALALGRGPRRMTRELLHAPSAIAALALIFVACAQPILLAQSDGVATLYRDQVGMRVAASWTDVPGRLVEYVGSTIKYFPLWTGLVVVAAFADRRRVAEAWTKHRAALILVLAWFAVLLAIFSAANWYRGRYMAPAYPPLACALAAVLAYTLQGAQAGRAGRAVCRVLLLVLAGLAVLFAVGMARIDAGACAALLAGGIGATAAWFLVRNSMGIQPLVALGSCLFAITALIGAFVTPALSRVPVEALVARLLEFGQPASIAHVNGTMTSQLRLMSDGRLDVGIIQPTSSDDERARIPVWIVPGAMKESFEGRGRELEACASELHVPHGLALWKLLWSADPRAEMERYAEVFYVARAPDSKR